MKIVMCCVITLFLIGCADNKSITYVDGKPVLKNRKNNPLLKAYDDLDFMRLLSYGRGHCDVYTNAYNTKKCKHHFRSSIKSPNGRAVFPGAKYYHLFDGRVWDKFHKLFDKVNYPSDSGYPRRIKGIVK